MSSPTRSSAPSRSSKPTTAPASQPAPKPTAAPASVSQQRAAGQTAAPPARTTSAPPSTKDTVSQDILESSKPVSQGTQNLMGGFASNFETEQAPKKAATPQPDTAEMKAKRQKEAAGLISERTSWGNLDETALGKDLGNRDPKLVNETFNQLGDGNRDDVGLSYAQNMSDDRIRELAGTEEGQKTLRRVIGDLNTGQVYQSEAEQVQRLGKLLGGKHSRLLDDTLPEAAAKGVKDAGMTHQPLKNGNGRIDFDDYSITVDKMPPGVTPEEFLRRLRNDPNGAIPGENFKGWTEFARRGDPKADAKPGDIYDIDMYGPENGSVVLRDSAPDHFTVSTVHGPPYSEHPIYGNREFGFEKNDDGSTTFYTRAADRREWMSGQLPLGLQTARAGQAETWRSMMKDLGAQIDDMGGFTRPGSFREGHDLQ